MFKPISDYMVIELARDPASKIELPEDITNQADSVFIVKQVGPGIVQDDGKLFTPDVKVGDQVITAGKIVKFLIDGESILIGRTSDVVGVSREVEKKEPVAV